MESDRATGLIGAIRGCSSWPDIQRKWGALPAAHKGELFEELVKAYLQLDPEYATKLKHVWFQREVPQAVRRKLGLPATDQGIDLVAETKAGEFWAIQCKYRQHTDQTLPWREISTFEGLAFGVCRGFAFGLICSTTERFKCWDRLAKLSWRPFAEAREFVRGLGLRSRSEWARFCKGDMPDKGTLPSDVPCSPERKYADQGWEGVGDWLGTGMVAPFLAYRRERR